MGIKEWNRIFGYGHFIVGASKIILIFLLAPKILSILNGENVDISSDNFFATLIGFIQIILIIGSIVMIILNMKRQPKIITGYLLGIGAALIEFILPSFILIFFIIAECGIYMKAGNKIISVNEGIDDKTSKDKKQIMKDTEWFYGNK